MKVVFVKRSTTSDGRLHLAGDIAEIPNDIAGDLIRRGIAKESSEAITTEEQEEDDAS